MKERNLRKFINDAVVISEESAVFSGDIGFISRFLIQTTFPHSDPGDVFDITRVNGREAVSLRSGFCLDQDGNKINTGLPFGVIPRLILVWLSSEVTRTKSREVFLGKNISDFMRKIGLTSLTGGKNGSITRVKEQLIRLFFSSFFIYKDQNNGVITEQFSSSFRIAQQTKFWWDNRDSSDINGVLFLDDVFYERATESMIPVDLRVIRILKNSPIALDVYSWLTYRFSYLSKITRIPWKSLMAQFGSGFENSSSGVRAFRIRVEEALKKINTVWPINVECNKDFLILRPTKPHISKTKNIKILNI